MHSEAETRSTTGAAQFSDHSERLIQLARLAGELGSEYVRTEAADLAARISEGRFYVACVGQFKRGKSTLIGALIGESLLPTGFTPVTAVPTVIRYGSATAAHIRAADGSWTEIPVAALDQYVSEEHNPENAKCVAGVEVFVPSPLLATGMCLVDTPGLGSVFAGNTAATHAFIPHIDAALVVTGSDPPLGGEEFALVESVAKNVAHLIVVLNKADKASEEERSAAVKFTRQLLEKRLGREIGSIFQVSATEQLAGRIRWEWSELVCSLEKLVQDSGAALLLSAGERGIERLSEELLAIIEEEHNALLRPLEESERRIAAMKQTIAEASRSMRDLGYLLMGEQHRLSDYFLDRRKRFLAAALPEAQREFDEYLRSAPRVRGSLHRRNANAKALEIARRVILPWLEPEEAEGERQYRAVSRRFLQAANEFLEKLASAGVPELARWVRALDSEAGFQVRSEFRFRDFLQIARPASPVRRLGDILLALAGLRRVLDDETRWFMEWLFEVNSSRVQNDVLNRIQESRNRLEAEIRKLLLEVSRVAETALARARETQAEGSEAVATAIHRLNTLRAQLSGIEFLSEAALD